MQVSISFSVAGTPVTKGSFKTIYNRAMGKVVAIPSNGADQRKWEANVAQEAAIAKANMKNGLKLWPTDNPIEAKIVFYLQRPMAHYGAYGLKNRFLNLFHTKKPDLDKLTRCTLDALTGLLYKDDAQVYKLIVEKRYANESSGVLLTIAQDQPTESAEDTGTPDCFSEQEGGEDQGRSSRGDMVLVSN
jgi:Holliday junction resolvase RusA-like endonuclease